MAADVASREVKALPSKPRIAAAAVVILLTLFLVRPGASGLKSRIANSISRAVGRPTDVTSVHLRFLPRPGFDLENLVIYEDPAFGAEPMLRAAEVTAVVRLTSLLRGRLDISRLELTEPSLNLMQRGDGQWNLAALLERSARTPLAPTTKAKMEPRLGFPYIEASSGRINFKTGAEKKPYALLNADFALWQESENTWGVRLKAEPLRTDMNLSDTGLLLLNGTWQRAGSLRETPLQFSIEWERAQLGQMTKLLSGNDKGWRGDVRLRLTLSGKPDAMLVVADGAIQDFHRYDIPTTDSLALAAHCEGKYNSTDGMMRDISCLGPVGDGMINLRGEAGRPGKHSMNLLLNAENVPAGSVVQLARRSKKDLPADLLATGNVQASLSVKTENRSTGESEFQGSGEITNLRVESAAANAEFAAGTIPFSLNEEGYMHLSSKSRSARKAGIKGSRGFDQLRLEYGPLPVGLGGSAPAQARGWVTRSGYALMVRGNAEVADTLHMAALLGLPVTKANVEGMAQLDLQIAGSWAGSSAGTTSGFISPKVTGTADLHNLRVMVRGVNEAIEISSAELNLLPAEARVAKLDARFADARWTGSLDLPRGCGTPGACAIRFNLNTDAVTIDSLYAVLGTKSKERRWYQVLTPATTGPPLFLTNVRATGTVNAGRVQVQELVGNRVSATVDVDHGKLKISNLRGDVLGGKHQGEWVADFSGAAPVYAGTGTLSGVSLEELADAMHDGWISGTASGSYQLKSSGADATAFWKSAEGDIHFEARDGALPHVSLGNDGDPLQIGRWKGLARLRAGGIEVVKSEIESSGGVYQVSGRASLAHALDFKLSGGPLNAPATAYSITGTLAVPHVAVEPTTDTQAQLKR